MAGAAATAVVRAEIDTSAPFLSVKEAVDWFGGSGSWNSQLVRRLKSTDRIGETVTADSSSEAEEQVAELEKQLVAKERETLEVLRELEETKKVVAELKWKVQKESAETAIESDVGSGNRQAVELEEVKLSLIKTASSLVEIRESIDSLKNGVERERALIERSQQKLSDNAAVISSLEEGLSESIGKLQDLEAGTNLNQMSCEIERLREVAHAAKLEAADLAMEIEATKCSAAAVEIQRAAAEKMAAAARAAEALAFAEIRAMMCSNEAVVTGNGISISVDEYTELVGRAREAEEASRKKVEVAMAEVDMADESRSESEKKLEEALERLEAAKGAKLAAEDALRRWSGAAVQRATLRSGPMSIGQILSLKLMGPEEYYGRCVAESAMLTSSSGGSSGVSVSLGQLLNRKRESERDRRSARTRRFGFTGIALLGTRRRRKKGRRRPLC